jgi:hypothetical protein
MRPARTSFHRALASTILLALALAGGGPARAADGDLAGTTMESKRTRGTWATLLVGYVALGALATGATYLLRDNLFGRGLAVGAAGWGGFGLGGSVAYGLVHLSGCESDCTAKEEVAIAVGGLVGGAAASLAAQLLTSDPGMSRPYTTAAGLAPAFFILTIGTITDW